MDSISNPVNTGRFVYKDTDLQVFEDSCKERIKAMQSWAQSEMHQVLSTPGFDIKDEAKVAQIWKSCREKASAKLDADWFHNDPEKDKYKEVVMSFITTAFRSCLAKQRQ